MRVELTAGERAQLRELGAQRSLGERSGYLRPELAARWRQLQDGIARAHGVHPGDARFRADGATGRAWIEVSPRPVEVRAAAAARFADSIEAFLVEELPMEVDATAAARLRAKLEAGGPILVGERHGVEQNPLVAYTLMRRFDLRVLGLEWSTDLQPAVDAFLAGGPLAVEPFTDSGDGRITAGHFAVLRSLRRARLLDRVVLFDPSPWPATWSERDRGMAVRLLQETRRTPALVMAGGLHTRLRRHRHGEPLGVHVAAARPGTIEVRLRYPGDVVSGVRRDACALRSAGAWLELTVPDARPGVTPAG
jgi:hypothetical protein